MRAKFTVHSAEAQSFEAEVEFAGKKVRAPVPGLIVELVSEDGMNCPTLRFIPDDMEAAKALFAVGSVVEGVFAAPAAAKK